MIQKQTLNTRTRALATWMRRVASSGERTVASDAGADESDDESDAFLEVLVLFLSRMCHKDYKVSLVS